jgi:autotransporter-associated beta strand protein
MALALLNPLGASAASGIWTHTTSGGLWSATGNWSGGTVADGSGSTADFNTIDITADNTVHLDASRSLAILIFGDLDTATAAGWILDNDNNAANLLTLAGTAPTITVNALGTGKDATIGAVIDGASGLTKDGAGTLTLTGVNTYRGQTTVSAGTLTVSGGAINNTTKLWVGGGGSGTSVFNLTDGAVTTAANIHMLVVGDTSPGSVTISGGALNTSYVQNGNNGPCVVVGGGKIGSYTQTGGTVENGNWWGDGFVLTSDLGGSGSSASFSGGSYTTTGCLTLGVRGDSTVTVSGTAQVNVAFVKLGQLTASTQTSSSTAARSHRALASSMPQAPLR